MNSMEITELYVPEEEKNRVYKAILLAQEIKEESWDRLRTFYVINDNQAASIATKAMGLKDHWSGIIGWWNMSMWNDVQSWAEYCLNHKEK